MFKYINESMEDTLRPTVDDIYTALVNNGDMPASDDETVKAIHKSTICSMMEQSKKDLDRLFSPSYRILSELIREYLKELDEQGDTLSAAEKLKKQISIYTLYRYQSMLVELWTD